MPSPLLDLILSRIRAHGPLTFAAYMDLALYHPDLGYYASSARRSGRAGDFYTSVDVGPLFGELLAKQLAEMWRLLTPDPRSPIPDPGFDLVEAAAGDGRLARDILDAAHAADPAFHGAIRLHLVERSARARARQRATLGPHAVRLAGQPDGLPPAVTGVIFANELLDALPVHLVAMTGEGLREIFVAARGTTLVEQPGPPSTPALAAALDASGARLRPGWRAEVSLAALDWMRAAARALCRGFLMVIDYGHPAPALYSAAHARGTIGAHVAHRFAGDAGPDGTAPWLTEPGARDITAHVDLTAVTRTAGEEGLQTLCALDQTYFLLALGIAGCLEADAGAGGSPEALKRRLGAKGLIMPGGLGSTMKVLIFGRGVGTPRLLGCSGPARLT